MNYFKTLLELFWLFCKIGSVTFGGGIAMLPILERELVDKRHWIDSDELLDYYAIGQSTPGIIAVNVATFVGYKRAKFAGGVIATLGIITPCIVVITLLAAFIGSIDKIKWVKKALSGINVAVAANLTYGTFNIAKKSVKDAAGIFLFLVCFLAIFVLNISTVWVIFSAAGLGLVQHFFINFRSIMRRRKD
ncbi:chromate transporter [Treponema parvum]|uniref:chromate transporter n=1 Tax=Treponema parvum TaxID=138851 RepID=UPI001AEC3673|nr:chromate transporter [Treponema parvum]QTQ16154.1 chromate transporter [Treponema parvum]